jgi:Glu-tRNA(Gln) amidotransferase subunit E-like FAD-binding protein
MKEKQPVCIVKRKLHPVPSELGEIDVAAQYEWLRDRTFYYQVFKNESCLVELDEEPPHPVNREALEIALQIALLLNCKIPDEIHVMRKIVIDGSNTSGFQRTMIVGRNGFLEYKGRKIGITNVCLEEDAAALVKEENGNVYYKLNRLGIPLVEIATETIEGFSPQEIQDIAYTIGLIAKSTGKIRKGIGAIRQDVNVSIKGGARVEIKGVQKLELLAKVIELEAKRQLELIQRGEKVEEETRAAYPDGTTRYTRPLPGAGRLYPETDIEPISIGEKFLRRLKRELPELLTKKVERFKEMKLPEEIANQIVHSKYLKIFEKIVRTKKVKPILVATTFLQTLKDLKRRESVEVEKLKEEHFVEIFDFLEKGKIVKESIPEILKYLAKNPEKSVENAVEELNLKPITIDELKKIIEEAIGQKLPFDKTYGIVMSRVRGRIDALLVKKMLEEYFRKI